VPTYTFEAKDLAGNRLRGRLSAKSEDAAAETLRKKGYTISKLERKRGVYDAILAILGHVTPTDKVISYRQLSTMISAGLPLLQSLKILAEQTRNNYFKKAWEQIAKDVENGLSFFAAVSRFPQIFSSVFINMVKSGERSGTLDKVLKTLANDQEKEAEIRGKIRSAMIYPIFVVMTVIIAAALMMTMVIPNLKNIFEQAGAQLPLSTRILIDISNFTVGYWPSILVTIFVLIAVFAIGLRTDLGRNIKDFVVIYIPFFKRLTIQTYWARFGSVLSLLISGGIPILDALDISADIIPNHLYRDAVKRVAKDVERGVPLSESLKKEKVIPQILIQMVSVGEQTGQVDQLLLSIAQYYEREVDQTIKGLLSLLEPALLIILGVGVAFFVFSILLPIYNIGQFQ
jgi:type IV pilus assembly protein PilC